MTTNTRTFGVFVAEELGHRKLLSGSVPLEVNITKPTLALAT